MLNDTIKALNDPIRRKILELLKNGPMTVGEILDNFNVTGATLTHHLHILRDADLVSSTKDGNKVIYEINTSVMEDVITWISGLMKGSGHNEK